MVFFSRLLRLVFSNWILPVVVQANDPNMIFIYFIQNRTLFLYYKSSNSFFFILDFTDIRGTKVSVNL